MIFRTKAKHPLALETIAFADIVINLFVFFFITFGLFATFDVSQKGILPIQLPKVKHSAAAKRLSPLIIMIDRNGIPYLGSRKIALSELRKSVNYELSSRKEKGIVVRADRTISLEQFVSVLDVIRSTKARSVAIETDN